MRGFELAFTSWVVDQFQNWILMGAVMLPTTVGMATRCLSLSLGGAPP